MPAPRPTHQFRFVATRMARAPGLSEGVKYVAAYRMDDARSLAVLAQGRDKYTLKKWASLLRVGLDSVAPVDDMRRALEFAREQEGFSELGTFSYQRGLRTGPVTLQVSKAPKEAMPELPAQIQEEASVNAEETPVIYLVAREAAQQMTERLEERERARLMDADIETDLDHLYPHCAGDQRDFRQGMRLVARQAALQYVKRLEYAGRMCSQDAVPRALRAGWVG